MRYYLAYTLRRVLTQRLDYFPLLMKKKSYKIKVNDFLSSLHTNKHTHIHTYIYTYAHTHTHVFSLSDAGTLTNTSLN